MIKSVDTAIQGVPGLANRAEQLSKAIHKVVLEAGEPARCIMDGLHGTWLGHPLHPLLTDLVIGSWSLAVLFDLLSLKGRSRQAEQTADTLIAIGAVATVPTALSGLADFSAIPKSAASTALVHAVVTDISLGLYLLSLVARKKGRRRQGMLLSALGFGVLSLGAYLGGHLVFGKQVGVNRTKPAAEPSTWQTVLTEKELPAHQPKCIEVKGTPWLLYRNGKQIYAVGAICPHAEAPLEEGKFADLKVQCPWHDSVFDLRDGAVVHGPATYPLPQYQARIRDGKIEVRVPKES